MTHAELRKLQWAYRRAKWLKRHMEDRDYWKADGLLYDLIPDLMRANTEFIIKACAEKLGPPPETDV